MILDLIAENPQKNHYAFAVDNKLSKFLPITIKSIIDNNSNNIFHIISKIISNKDKKKLKRLIREHPDNVIYFYNIDDSKLSNLFKSKWPITAWYRILLPEILPSNIKKVLYLDVDTLVLNDLRDIFQINMENKSIAAILDVGTFRDETYFRVDYDKSFGYICSGVLMMNLEYWRKFDLTNKIIDWALNNKNRLITPDQDAINQICHNSKMILPLRYNIVPFYFTDKDFYKYCNFTELQECMERPAIIHFVGYAPWKADVPQHFYSERWLEYKKSLKIHYFRTYESKGTKIFWKILIWNLIHPKYIRKFKINEDLKKKIGLIEDDI